MSTPMLVGLGHTGHIHQLSERIALKQPHRADDKGFLTENEVFDTLESKPHSPSLIRSFRRTTSANFLEFLPGDNLETRLRRHQIRDPGTGQVLAVHYQEPRHLVLRWMIELTDAVATLESSGYAHADLRPPNLLLDDDDHLKVIDFDSTSAIGSPILGAQPPYARVLGDGEGAERGSFGDYGPRTEQFAIGSILYFLTRGFEPYDNEWFGKHHGPKTVDLLQEMKFPETDGGEFDMVIRKCWFGKYGSVQELNQDVIQLARDTDVCLAQSMQEDVFRARQRECEQLLRDGILDAVPRCLLCQRKS
ncbi:MAG: hypothetical protein M1838_003224 [Thelocarpon superellum]|nr:MAG: hypothetical protein M1838_003224 [Thelocarpon superellum]